MADRVYTEGQRVRLLANPTEGWPEETGTVLGTDGKPHLYVVEVDVAQGPRDDRLRGSCLPEHMEPL